MKKIIVLILAIVLSTNCFAQTDTTSKKDISEDVVFTVVQVPAHFPGGIEGWKEYLEQNLNGNLSKKIPLENGQSSSKQKVILSFIVNREGNVSDIKCENPNEVLPKLVEEAIRVMKKSPKWVPAVQNGMKVIYRHRQAITWVHYKT
jgi:protein TonB